MKRVGILAALCVVLAAVLMIRFTGFGTVPQCLPETADAPPDEPTRPAVYRSNVWACRANSPEIY